MPGTSVSEMAQQAQKRPSTSERRVSGMPTRSGDLGRSSLIDAERSANRRWPLLASSAVGLLIGLLAGLVGLPVSPIVALALFVIVGLVVSILLRRIAPAAPARTIGAAPVAVGELPRIETLLDGLAATFGVAVPAVALLDDPVINACIVGRPGTTTVVVTRGLLEALSVVEIEGVLAQLLALDRLDAVERGSMGAGLALLLGPLGRRPELSKRLTGSGRLFRADELAALTVRYPVGLAAALRAMEQGPLPGEGSLFASPIFNALRWLFIDPSVGRRSRDEAMGDVDATSVRRAALEEW